MEGLKFNIRLNGREVSNEELDRYIYERTLHTLHELKYLGATITHEGKSLSHIDINWLEPTLAQHILLETKATLGEKGIIKLLKEVLADSDRRWKSYAQEPIEQQGVWLSQCDLQVKGVGFEVMKAIFSMEDLRMGLSVMPEHYYFAGSVESGEQYILETFGLFGEPTYTIGKVLSEFSDFLIPYKDESYPMQMVGESVLHSDGTHIYVGAYHQTKPETDGFAMRSVYYCPKNAPKAVAEGHAIHFAVELREGIKAGYKLMQEK